MSQLAVLKRLRDRLGRKLLEALTLVLLLTAACQNPATPPDAFGTDGDANLAELPTECEPSPGSCSMDGTDVDCSLAVWDVHSSGLMRLPGAKSPREVCEAVCGADSARLFNGQWILYDKGECNHQTTIKGLTCASCCGLSAQPPTGVWCDADQCTYDWCTWDTCHHAKFSWIGAACALPGAAEATGTLACEPGGECGGYGYCPQEKLKKCVEASPSP